MDADARRRAEEVPLECLAHGTDFTYCSHVDCHQPRVRTVDGITRAITDAVAQAVSAYPLCEGDYRAVQERAKLAEAKVTQQAEEIARLTRASTVWEQTARQMEVNYETFRDLSARLRAALQRAIGTCFTEWAHHEVMSNPHHFVNEALRAGN